MSLKPCEENKNMRAQRKMSRALTHPGALKSDLESCPECQTLQEDGLPKFRTPMFMLQKVGNVERKLRVVLSIYSTNYDLYAVVSQDRNIIVKDCGYIKLKNCLVTMDMNNLTLEIIQKNYEGISLRFKVNKTEHLDEISKILHLNDDYVSDTCSVGSSSPLSSSPIDSMLHPALKNLRVPPSSQITRSPRGSPLEKRKLSMPVLAEDEESEEEHDTLSLPGDTGCESEE